MIDFHSHILPEMDDGSRNIEESIAMLNLSYEQGIRQIVATSHYYASKESPDSFLKRRDQAWNSLQPHLTEQMPSIHLGAEVYYFDGICNSEEISQLCIQGTDILLLEMPFKRWSERMISDIIELGASTGLTVLLAHIDRYLKYQPKELWRDLTENDIKFQVNASAFLDGWFMRKKVMNLLKEEMITVLGSDCHNMSSRKPNLEEAVLMIKRKASERELQILESGSCELLSK